MPQRSENRSAATGKALEGGLLLSRRDYVGAIAACTEAIELDPGIIGAYSSRAQAYRRLGMETETEADLAHLNDLRRANQTVSGNLETEYFSSKTDLTGGGPWWTLRPEDHAFFERFYWKILAGLVLIGILIYRFL